MKSFTALSFLAAAAVVQAQSSSSSTSTSTADALIPTGISTGCSSFLEALNSNSTLSSCIAPIVNATSAFSPLANSSNASSGAVTSALGSLCASSSSCSDSAIRGQLTSFYTACSDELTGSAPNTDVIRIYDVLYTITPLKEAVCAKDDSGNYCVTQVSSSGSDSSVSASASTSTLSAGSKSVSSTGQSAHELVQNNLWSYASGSSTSKRADSSDGSAALVPNTTTFRSSNLAFLFLTPGMSSSELCTSCTRSVLSAYITWEQAVPYACGLTNSPILGGQSDLYKAITDTCGSNFMSGAVQAAGGLSGGLVSGAAPHLSAEGGLFTAAAATVLGLITML